MVRDHLSPRDALICAHWFLNTLLSGKMSVPIERADGGMAEKNRTETAEQIALEWLGEEIGKHGLRGTMFHSDTVPL